MEIFIPYKLIEEPDRHRGGIYTTQIWFELQNLCEDRLFHPTVKKQSLQMNARM